MQSVKTIPRGWLIGLFGAICTAVGLKVGLLLAGVIPFNADEAIVALMARHILQGERPIFFYGQAYMGSLDAFLVAGAFKLLGSSVWAVRWIQIVLYSFTIFTTFLLGKKLTDSWKVGIISAWFLAIPSLNMTLYTTVSMGGYGEMLLIGNLILLTTLRITRELNRNDPSMSIMPWFILGFLSGLGLWAFGMTLVYSIPAFLYLTWYWYKVKPRSQEMKNNYDWWRKLRYDHKIGKRVKPRYGASLFGVAAIGMVFGSVPWLAYAQQSGVSKLVSELSGSAISGVENLNPLAQIIRHMLNFGLFGSTVVMGLRPPWEIRWLALPLAPFVLTFWVGVLVYVIKKLRVSPREPGFTHALLLVGVALMVIVGFIVTPFGADPSGRYFLPIGVVMAIFASQAVWEWQKKWGAYVWVVVGLLLAFNFWGTLQVARIRPPGVTTQFDPVTQIDHEYDQQLIEFLESEGENRGYSNYWVAYPLAFLSDERLIFTPRLPYHQDLRYTTRDDRYHPYRQLVDQSDYTTYITTNNPSLDEKLRSSLEDLDVTWNETTIGDYQVYYHLSRAVIPEEVGLGGIE